MLIVYFSFPNNFSISQNVTEDANGKTINSNYMNPELKNKNISSSP